VPGPCYAVIHGAAPRPPLAWQGDALAGVEPLAWFDCERAALRSAVRQACQVGDDELAFDLAGCLEKYFDIRGMYVEWRSTNELVLAACQAAGNRLGEAVMLRGLLDVLTWNTTAPGGEAMARMYADASHLLAIFTEVGEERGMSDAAVMCSWGLTARGEYAAALEVASRALELAERAGHTGGQARAHVALAIAHGEQRRLGTSLDHLTHALTLARQLGNRRYEATVQQFLGMAYREMGDLIASEHALDESLAISRGYRDQYSESLSQLELARLYLKRGDPRARSAAQNSLRLGREHSMSHHVADALSVLGAVELADGRPNQAAGHLEEAVRLWRTRGWPSFLASALRNLGQAYAGCDDNAAYAAWREAREIYRQLGNEAEADALEALLAVPPAPAPR
jgi:tetratricopeptide (TPR) repeat protein